MDKKLAAMVDCDVIDLETRAAWLEYRQANPGVGASELPCLFGAAGKNRSQYWLWERRINPDLVAEDASDEAEMAGWGNLMESPILAHYAQKTGETVHPWPQTAICAARDFAGFCTPDAILIDDAGPKLGEVKAWDENAAWLWAEGIPDSVLCQVQQQMRITGIHRAVVILLLGNKIHKLRTYDVEYDPDFGLDIEDRCNRFAEYVTTQTPPPIDESEATYEALKRLHPDDNGETVELPDEVDGLTREWHALKAQADGIEARLAWIKNHVCALIGDNTFGETAAGTRWSWKTVDRKAYTVAAGSYRRLNAPRAPKGDA